MKKILLSVFVASLLIIGVQAQDKKPLQKIAAQEDRFITSINLDNWTDIPADMETKTFRSRGISLMVMQDVKNKSGFLGLGFGFGFSSQNVHSNAFPSDDSTGKVTVMNIIPDSISYDINKLSLNYLDLAFEFRLQSRANKSGKRFKLSAGFKGGILLQSHTKFEDKDGKSKTYSIDNLNLIQYGPTFRIGYGNIALSGYYSLAKVFEDKKGTELTPYSIGIAFTK